MSMETERQAIYTHFRDNWDFPQIPTILYEDFDDATDLEAVDSHVYLSILSGDSRLRSIGGPGQQLFEHLGIVQLDIYYPFGQGTGLGRQAADAARLIFRNQQFHTSDGERINFSEPSVRKGGQEQGKVRFIVSCPFYRDEVA